ncbi:MAG: 30S ribosomal protein S3 [Spirochaetes bacterium GWB1_66_5]|jgi:small subunit ribosomal protein S3|uniref:30S ribosomal protein S3 n=1 Tax=uncultured organism TaxID=155900 RepID=U3GT66_9ZZZZ|nr:30S ribosomal protein S3 [uncultured organism]OHD25395.1 MAG: 30S ribosomal protein S3 [Spirochaetes bacterium GWB1_66_5]
MGQKVNPYGLRLGINKTWKSKWYVDPKEYANTLHEDLRLRKVIGEAQETQGSDIADLEIIRHPQRITLIIHTGRPGVIIGAKGANIEKLGKRLQKMVGKKIQIKIKEIGRPETDAQLIAENVGRQLKARASFRRAMKMAVANAMKAGVQGAKIRVSGRLGGSEIARTEQFKEGRIPLHTFRADIDYGAATSITTFGSIGIKVWVYKGELFGGEKKEDAGLLLRKQRERERERVRS